MQAREVVKTSEVAVSLGALPMVEGALMEMPPSYAPSAHSVQNLRDGLYRLCTHTVPNGVKLGKAAIFFRIPGTH